MNIRKIVENNIEIARIDFDEILIKDIQSALDLMATIWYQEGCNRIILDKSAICEDFFDLRTGLAGEILQKFINYQTRVAIIGNFTAYSSKSLKDFIYECNQGKEIFFVRNEQEAIDKLRMN